MKRAWTVAACLAATAAAFLILSVAGAGPNSRAGAPQAAAGCTDGFADIYPCSNVDLLSHLPLSAIGGGSGNDIWGWTDPLTGQEYALVGRSSGTSFVDVTDPEDPIYVGNLPTHTQSSTWRDIKVYQDHAFIVSEAFNHGLQVFDLTELRDVTTPPVTFSETAHYAGFGNSHNVAINEDTGFAYAVGTSTCSGGLHMVDIGNPTAPVFAGCFSSDGYTHDTQCVVYQGPDTAHQGSEICFNSNEDTLTIVDVENKAAPVQLARKTYTGSAYTHQGWLTEDHRFFLIDDELDEVFFGHTTKTYIWDVSDLENPFILATYLGPVHSIDHNQYVKGSFDYQANYSSGLRVLDLGDIASGTLTQVGFFDTFPSDAESPEHEEIFDGLWSVYPYYASGVVVVNDISEGLFVLRPALEGEAVLGGSIAGVSGTRATCRDTTTGESVTIVLGGAMSWDCVAAGLDFSAGDTILQSVRGNALGSAISGSVGGVAGTRAICQNQTTGQRVSVQLGGGTAFDCTGAGFLANDGERVAVTVQGTAE